MSRIIKFRVKDNNDGQIKEVITLGKEYVEVGMKRFPFTEKIYDYELMQYTGVNDMNGVEIFEGDIIMEEDYSNGAYLMGKQPRKKKVVDFRTDGCIGFKVGFNITHLENIEVVSNIYEQEGEKYCI